MDTPSIFCHIVHKPPQILYNRINAALVCTNISGAKGARHSMAIKPSNKPRKTPSAKQGAPKTKSTVTPIAQVSHGTESNNRAFSSVRIEEEIRIRAYEFFEQRGRQEGFHDADWARAEAEVLAKYRRDKSA